MFFSGIINLNSWLKNNFLLLIYRIFKMPRKVLYNSEDEESIEDEQPIQKQNIIKTPKIELPAPETKQPAPIRNDVELSTNMKTKPDINCPHCKKQFSRQTILNKHLNEFRCKGLREVQLQKEEEMIRKQSELNALEEKMFIQIKKKQARMEKQMMKEQEKEELQQQKNIIKEKKITKPKKEVKQSVEKEVKPVVQQVKQERAKYIISF